MSYIIDTEAIKSDLGDKIRLLPRCLALFAATNKDRKYFLHVVVTSNTSHRQVSIGNIFFTT